MLLGICIHQGDTKKWSRNARASGNSQSIALYKAFKSRVLVGAVLRSPSRTIQQSNISSYQAIAHGVHGGNWMAQVRNASSFFRKRASRQSHFC